MSGQAILGAANLTVTLRNNSTGLTSGGVSRNNSTGLTSGGVSRSVQNPSPPVINQIATSPTPPIHGQAFIIILTWLELWNELDGVLQRTGLRFAM